MWWRSCIVGVGFSGVLALAARGRTFERLSLQYITAVGAGGGFLYFLFIAAAATLLLARRRGRRSSPARGHSALARVRLQSP